MIAKGFVALIVLAAAWVLPAAAVATPPGVNGLIACSYTGGLRILNLDDPNASYEDLEGRFADGGSFAWSPDGRQFVWGGEVNLEARSIDPQFRDHRPITQFDWPPPSMPSSWIIADDPDWSPDGQRIAYTRLDGKTPQEGDWRLGVPSVWTAKADSSGDHRWVAAGKEPAWSPDGTRIAYSYKGDIFHVSSGGGAATRVTDDSDADVAPSWSPDGQWIAYVSDANGSAHIFIRRTDGSAQRQITFQDRTFEPAWSPDGARIAYNTAPGPGSEGPVWTAAPTGGDERLAGSHCRDPDWQRLLDATPALPGPTPATPPSSQSGPPATGTGTSGLSGSIVASGNVQGETGARLTAKEARSRTREYLSDRYATFRKASRRRIGPCVRVSETRLRCRVAWRTKRFRYSGRVATTLSGDDVTAKGRVKRLRR